MLNSLVRASLNGSYWWGLALLGLLLESVALFYQHALDEPPCVVCIQVRIIVLVILLLAVAGGLLSRYRKIQIGLHAAVTLAAAVLLERSWELFGTERGFVIGACGFDLGLPGWLALDKWLPAMFEVQTTCGYTPILLFGITMAESLLVLSVLLLLSSILLTVMTLRLSLKSE